MPRGALDVLYLSCDGGAVFADLPAGFRGERFFGMLAGLVGPEPERRGLCPLSPPAGGTSSSPYNPLVSGLDLGCTEYRTDYGRP
jgi:hypothetical protein